MDSVTVGELGDSVILIYLVICVTVKKIITEILQTYAIRIQKTKGKWSDTIT